MRILVVGGGGREHALCWAISASPLCTKLYCAPGNAGVSGSAEELCTQGGGGYGPAQGMFAASAAHHQDSHNLNLLKCRLFLTI